MRGQIYAALNSKNGKIFEAVWGHLKAVEEEDWSQKINLSAVKFDSKSNFDQMASIKATWIFGHRSLSSNWEMTEAKLRLLWGKKMQYGHFAAETKSNFYKKCEQPPRPL